MEFKLPASFVFNSDFGNSSKDHQLKRFVVSVNVSHEIVPTEQVQYKIATVSYATSSWGPKRDSLFIVIPISLLYVAILITGLLGNICTCIVIARNRSMHTATNYYLFSLAVSDLLLLVAGLPTEIYSTWYKYPYVFGEAFCILQGFAAEASANATVLTITAFTIERYVAICHPFLSHTMSKLSRAIKFIIVIWILAMCLALPQAMAFGIIYEPSADDVSQEDAQNCLCTVKRTVIPHAFEISTFLFFIAPMSAITVFYILIGVRIKKSTTSHTRDGSIRLKHCNFKECENNMNRVAISMETQADKVNLTSEEEGRKNYSRNSQASKHVVKMLVAVVMAFFICWAPFHAQRLLAIYGQQDSARVITTYNVLTYISGVFYYLSTTINPVLYHIMSHKFRVAFKETIIRMLRKKQRPDCERYYSALSARSSQINSQSNTDSCSQHSTIRYLETEMKRLRESNRPIVVSFRQKQPALQQKPKQVTVIDAELQKALDSLAEESTRFEKIRRHSKSSRGCLRKHRRSTECTSGHIPNGCDIDEEEASHCSPSNADDDNGKVISKSRTLPNMTEISLHNVES